VKCGIAPLSLVLVLGSTQFASAQPDPAPADPELEPAPQPADDVAAQPESPPDSAGELEAGAEPAPPESPSEPLLAEVPVEQAEQPIEQDEGDDIVVTGTRIRQTSFNNAAPVEVIGRKQLEQSGISNLAEVVQFLTVSQGTGPGAIASATGQGVNLRGLGAGATLVLVNGRRLNPSGNPLLVSGDISIIPLAAVERLEILKAGAAAIYGADAVGGVVNIITRRTWDGFRAQIDGQATQDIDLGEYTASAGFGSIAEHSRVLLAASYFRRSELTADEREFTAGKYVSTQGHPGAYLVPQDPTAEMPMPPPRLMPDPDCGLVLNTTVVATPNGQACSDSYRPYSSLIPAGERANAFGSGEYDLSEHLTVFGELTFSRFRGRNVIPILGVLPPYPIVPADHVDNPFDKDAQWMGRPRGGREHTEPQPLTTSDDSLRGVIGLKGDLAGVGEGSVFESWTYELYSSLGVSRFRRTINDNLRGPLQMALDSCADPADLSSCFNPFYSAVTGAGTANSQEVIDTFAGREVDVADQSLLTYNAGMAGTLFKLPGGELGIAFGAELRHETRASELDHSYRQGHYGFLGGSSDQKAERDVYSGYIELRWPLLDGLELQTAARVEHYSDFDSTPISPFAGLTLVPAELLGVSDSMPSLRRLQVRANVSRAFRAPTIFQTYPGDVTTATPLVRQGMTVATWIPVATSGNPDLHPETAYTLTGGFNWSPFDQLNLTADFWYYNYEDRIQPEIASQILAMWEATGGPMGLNMDPRVGFDPATNTVGPIYTQNINVDGAVITSGVDFGAMFNLGRDAPGNAGLFGIGVQGTYTFMYTIPRRETTLRAFANSAGMPQRLGPKNCDGSADVDLDMDPNNNAQNDQDRCDVAGSRNSNNIAPSLPRLRANVPLTWNLKGHSAAFVMHYFSSYDDDLQPLPSGELERIPTVYTFDLEYGYTLTDVVGERLGLRVGCENILNKYPPIVNGATTAYDAETHDPRGRMFFAKLSAEF
jgi:iron complex outermembrane recepter protein